MKKEPNSCDYYYEPNGGQAAMMVTNGHVGYNSVFELHDEFLHILGKHQIQ